jgi:hypothetical protein
MYKKHLTYLKEMFEDDTDLDGNFQRYPRRAVMSDLEVMSLAITSEVASINSENWLFSKLRTNYRSLIPNLIDRTRFNRRRRRLEPMFLEFAKRMSMTMGDGGKLDIVDSMPCPIVRNARERSYRICREDHLTAPRKGYSAVDRKYYIGYKLHLLTNENGVFQDMQVTPANVHDINFLKQHCFEDYSRGRTILGDRGYISKSLQADLFTSYDITLSVPYRKNQRDTKAVNREYGRKRRRIETQFAQLCDQFRMKANYAKSFKGFMTRLIAKLAGIACLQKLNIEKGRPLNHIKHAWS